MKSHVDGIGLVGDAKAELLPLLLLADEQENLVSAYLDRGDMWAVFEGGAVVSVCVVTDEGGGVFEVQNLATWPEHRCHGHATALLRHVAEHYKGPGRVLTVGTGDSPLTVPFYQHAGFVFSHRLPGWITQHYDHPIIEAGHLLTDKVYLSMPIG